MRHWLRGACLVGLFGALCSSASAQDDAVEYTVIGVVDSHGGIHYYQVPRGITEEMTALGLPGWPEVAVEDFLKELGETIFTQAKLLACEQDMPPETVTVSVSLGLEAVATGHVEVSSTWQTEELCRSDQ